MNQSESCDNTACGCESQLAEKTDTAMAQNQLQGKIRPQSWRTPVYEVKTVENGYELFIEVPGVAKEGVEVALAGENLVVTASKTPPPASWKPLKVNSSPDSYRLPLRVTVPLEIANITAKVEHGILTVKLPLATSSLPRTIEVA